MFKLVRQCILLNGVWGQPCTDASPKNHVDYCRGMIDDCADVLPAARFRTPCTNLCACVRFWQVAPMYKNEFTGPYQNVNITTGSASAFSGLCMPHANGTKPPFAGQTYLCAW